jgi:hypothetical protein
MGFRFAKKTTATRGLENIYATLMQLANGRRKRGRSYVARAFGNGLIILSAASQLENDDLRRAGLVTEAKSLALAFVHDQLPYRGEGEAELCAQGEAELLRQI